MSFIYLDYNSTTPVDPKVLESMLPWFSERFGNASSHSHRMGFEANAAVELARQQTAEAIGCETSEIIFTSGATEAINIAIRGTFKAFAAEGKHIISVKLPEKYATLIFQKKNGSFVATVFFMVMRRICVGLWYTTLNRNGNSVT